MDQTIVEQSTMKQILELLAKMDANQEQMISKLKAEREEMKAWRTKLKACREVTHACLEGKPAPEEESVAEPKEVLERATEQETGQAAEDRTCELGLAVRRRR
jgi:ABC-type antimicrobial peptide transport system ATPase subunit